MLRKIITALLIMAGAEMCGQQAMSFRYADSLTYSLYQEKDWNELIAEGRRSLNAGHDYYYMRMRIGIAFYEKKNYAMSARHFRKALEYNAGDQVALEYLFYSCFLSGKTSQAWALMPHLLPQNRERIVKESRIKRNTLAIESFASDSKTSDLISGADHWFTNPEPGSQLVTKYFVNSTLSSSHIIGKNISYFQTFTNLIKDNYLHYYDGTYYSDLDPQRVIQNQYYGSLSFFTSDGWVLNPSFHLYRASYNSIYIISQGANMNVVKYSSAIDGFYAGMNISKSAGFFTIGLDAGYTGFQAVHNFQGTFSLLLYPAGNAAFYFGGSLSGIKNADDTKEAPGLVGGAIAGLSASGRLWLELSALAGDLDNYAGSKGMFIYNSTDVLRNKFLARIIIPFFKSGLTLSGGAGLSNYRSRFINFDGEVSLSPNQINYRNINYTGGLSWKF